MQKAAKSQAKVPKLRGVQQRETKLQVKVDQVTLKMANLLTTEEAIAAAEPQKEFCVDQNAEFLA